MARRRFGSQQLGRGARLRKIWCRVVANGVNATAVQAAYLSCAVAESGLADATVLRSRGEFLITAVPDAANDEAVLGIGIIIVNQTALDIGGTALPGPIADANSDAWLYHSFVPLDGTTLTAADPQAIGVNVRVPVDSKAMRRVAADQAVVFMIELNQATFASVTIIGGIAFLFGT